MYYYSKLEGTNLMRHRKKWTLLETMSGFADVMEIIIALVLVIGISTLLVHLVIDMYKVLVSGGVFEFDKFLERLFNLIIGVEFTRMLCQHTPNTIIEVLMFAAARQLMIFHNGAIDMLIGVVAIALLFAVRKFLMPSTDQEDDSGYIFRKPLMLRKNSPTKNASGSKTEDALQDIAQ